MKTFRSAEQEAMFGRLDRFYRHAMDPALIEIERAACGCDYGGTSWTTRDEAHRLADLLGLAPGRHLLDIGAGSGWPGLYLARLSGCDLTLVDIPAAGLRLASERAAADRLPGGCFAIAADAAALPLAGQAFDAIGHSDVLCCLDAKLSVLAECRRVILGNGRMVFTVISIAPNLSPAKYARALNAGPPFKEAPAPYPDMLARTGWEILDCTDITSEYERTTRTMLGEEEARAARLIRILGGADFAERIARRRAALTAIEDGLLRRQLFAAAAR